MIQGKRGRGRPPGASRLNALDAKILDQMADIIAGRPVPPTTAMRQLGIEDDTMRRRLRRKWNAGGPVRVQAIKARRQLELAQIAARTACEKFSAFANAPELAAAVKSLNQFAQSPVWLEFGRKPVHAGDSGIRQKPGGDAARTRTASPAVGEPNAYDEHGRSRQAYSSSATSQARRIAGSAKRASRRRRERRC
jgi:hypothetical protein